MSVPKTVKLYNGASLPTVGLGTYKSAPGQVEEAVKFAIDTGYRHFDCAWFYGNEAEIGTAIREKIASGAVRREDLFITTKLWNNFHAKQHVIPKLKESLASFGLDYVDLFLIHWPFGFKEDASTLPTANDQEAYSDVDYLETWEGMEEAQRMGLTKSIGVSNFNSQQIERILENCTIRPVVNQVECNPNLNQKKLTKFCKERDIIIVGYCPLARGASGAPGAPAPLISDPRVIEIAKKHNKSPAQVILNYMVGNLGVVVIPKSVTPSRIKENIDIYDFVLESNDVAYLDSCHTNHRICPLNIYADHKYYSFNTEF